MREPTDSILVTLSKATIAEYGRQTYQRGIGFSRIIKDWLAADGENGTWSYKLANAPKMEIVWVYWVIGGKIRWRSRVLEIHRNKTIQFSNRSEPMFAKVWLEMFDFEKLPRPYIERKGFQGFRYYYPEDDIRDRSY